MKTTYLTQYMKAAGFVFLSVLTPPLMASDSLKLSYGSSLELGEGGYRKSAMVFIYGQPTGVFFSFSQSNTSSPKKPIPEDDAESGLIKGKFLKIVHRYNDSDSEIISKVSSEFSNLDGTNGVVRTEAILLQDFDRGSVQQSCHFPFDKLGEKDNCQVIDSNGSLKTVKLATQEVTTMNNVRKVTIQKGNIWAVFTPGKDSIMGVRDIRTLDAKTPTLEVYVSPKSPKFAKGDKQSLEMNYIFKKFP